MRGGGWEGWIRNFFSGWRFGFVLEFGDWFCWGFGKFCGVVGLSLGCGGGGGCGGGVCVWLVMCVCRWGECVVCVVGFV